MYIPSYIYAGQITYVPRQGSKNTNFPGSSELAKETTITLAADNPQENYFPRRLSTLKQTTFLGGPIISLARWQVKSGRSLAASLQ
jgi:hypothetical protein